MSNDIVTCHCSHECACFERGTGDMRQENHIFHRQQFWLNGGLILVNIEACTSDCVILQSLYKCFLIYDRGACTVNQDGTRFHYTYFSFTNQMVSGRHIESVDT